MHDFVGTLDAPREHSTRIRLTIANGDNLLKRRLAAHQRVAIQFRSMSPEVNPPTTDPASAQSAEIYATSMASPQPYGSSLP